MDSLRGDVPFERSDDLGTNVFTVKPSSPSSLGFILLHGFGGNADMMAETARLIASRGHVACSFQMASLMSFTSTGRKYRRDKNINSVLKLAATMKSRYNLTGIVLSGHSAGAAIALEAACAASGFENNDDPGIVMVIALDGVPWLQTIQHVNLKQQILPAPCDGNVSLFDNNGRIVFVSIRGEPGPWNHYNLIQHLLMQFDFEDAIVTAEQASDVVVPGALHGDFIANCEDGTLRVSGVSGLFMKHLLKIQTNGKIQSTIQKALLRIVDTASSLEGSSSFSLTKSLAGLDGLEIRALDVDKLRQSKLLDNLPPTLK